LATYISSELLGFPKEKLEKVTEVIGAHYKKQSFSKTDIEAIIDLLAFDKKNRNGIVYFVLLTDFGDYKTNQTVTNDLIYSAFDYYN
jgi:3-dehydroquinate synthase